MSDETWKDEYGQVTISSALLFDPPRLNIDAIIFDDMRRARLHTTAAWVPKHIPWRRLTAFDERFIRGPRTSLARTIAGREWPEGEYW